jgi:Holliday junction resolvasome RuvABC DNA-binding subunit
MLVSLANKIEDEQENPKKKKLKDLTQGVIINAYGDGLLNRQDTTNQLIALGYDLTEANLLLNIEDYNNNKSKSKSKKDEHNAKLSNLALKSYLNRAISRDSLISYLHQAGYSNSDAQSEVNLADAEYEISFKAQIAKDVERQYFEGLYNDNDVIISLQSLGFVASEANKILNELQILKTFRTKKPSISQLTKLFKDGYYSQEQYVTILKDEGYADDYIPAMLKLAGIDEEV